MRSKSSVGSVASSQWEERSHPATMVYMSDSAAASKPLSDIFALIRARLAYDGVTYSDEEWEQHVARLRETWMRRGVWNEDFMRPPILWSWPSHEEWEVIREEEERLREEARKAREDLVRAQISQSHYIRVGDFGNPAATAAAAALSDLLAPQPSTGSRCSDRDGNRPALQASE